MADEVDRASEQYAKYLEARIKNSRGQWSGVSGQGSLTPTVCVDCERPIPIKRRKAAPGCQRCIDCQRDFEGRGV